jgi:hypothetical protein
LEKKLKKEIREIHDGEDVRLVEGDNVYGSLRLKTRVCRFVPLEEIKRE